jgi:hypothetical protein
MFNWFNKETAHDKVVEERKEQLDNFLKNTTPQPEPERQYYSLGPTTEGRVMLKVYYGNVSMDKDGIDALIKTLEASKAWVDDRSGKQPEDGCQEAEQPV